MRVATKRGRRPDPNSLSSRIRALLLQGATARETVEQLGCTAALVHRARSRARANPHPVSLPSLAEVVREQLRAGLEPLAVADRLNCSAEYVWKVRSRMRKSEPAAPPRRVTLAIPHGPVSAEDAVRLMVDAVRRLQSEVAALRATVARIAEVVRDGLV